VNLFVSLFRRLPLRRLFPLRYEQRWSRLCIPVKFEISFTFSSVGCVWGLILFEGVTGVLWVVCFGIVGHCFQVRTSEFWQLLYAVMSFRGQVCVLFNAGPSRGVGLLWCLFVLKGQDLCCWYGFVCWCCGFRCLVFVRVWFLLYGLSKKDKWCVFVHGLVFLKEERCIWMHGLWYE